MQQSRYDRQQRFSMIGTEGQAKIESSKVLVIGVGALGSVVAELLARAGVGFIRIVDRDTVELTNLQRQSLYTEGDAEAGLAKVHAAASRLAEINSQVTIEPIAADVSSANIEAFAEGMDLIVDGTDNFEVRFLINDVAWETGIPWIHGGCIGASGQVFAFRPGYTICFRCLVPTLPDPSSIATCDTAGVLGPATHAIASLQSLEALKTLILPPETDAEARQLLLSVDFWAGRYRSLKTAGLRNPACPCCGEGKRDFLRGHHAAPAPVVLCGRNAVQLPPHSTSQPVVLSKVARGWEGLGEVSENRFLVRLTLADQRSITLFKDGRAVIAGTEDPVVARALFARFVGS